jgi:hypothetical protein
LNPSKVYYGKDGSQPCGAVEAPVTRVKRLKNEHHTSLTI